MMKQLHVHSPQSEEKVLFCGPQTWNPCLLLLLLLWFLQFEFIKLNTCSVVSNFERGNQCMCQPLCWCTRLNRVQYKETMGSSYLNGYLDMKPTDGCWWPCWESWAKTILIIIMMPPPLPESLGRRACSFNSQVGRRLVGPERQRLHMLPLFHLCPVIKKECTPCRRQQSYYVKGGSECGGTVKTLEGGGYITSSATMLEKHCGARFRPC